MSCSSCGTSNPSSHSIVNRSMVEPTPINLNCPYNIDMINTWIDRLDCSKRNGSYLTLNITKRQINRYEGILLSARNYSDNICYFESNLIQVENFMTVLTAQGIC